MTYPEGNSTSYTYDGRGNTLSATKAGKSGSNVANLVTSAAYSGDCANPKICNKPSSTTDVAGNVTTYAYDPDTGQPTRVTAPALSDGTYPETRYGYQWLQAWVKDANGNVALSPYAAKYLVSTSTCMTGNSCSGSANEIVTRVGYTPKDDANGRGTNVLPSSITVQAGSGGDAATTNLAYDLIGNVTSRTDPLGHVTQIRYNGVRQVTSTWGPDPDGAGPQRPRAVVTHYLGDGQPDSITQGTIDASGSNFTALQYTFVGYDAYGRKIAQRINGADNADPTAAYALKQYGYDAVGRLECTAQRMVPSTYNNLPAACQQTSGTPDRITRTAYEYAGGIDSVYTGVGVSGLERREVSYLHNMNGQPVRVTDAKGNTTGYQYDGQMRLVHTCFGGTEANCGSDFVELTYGTNGPGTGRIVNRSLRGHPTSITTRYDYDALGRVVTIDYPGDGATDRDVHVTYDLLGRVTQASDDGSHSVRYAYDALGRMTSQGDSISSRTMGYDVGGRRTSLGWSDGFYVTYDYDATDAVTAIRENGAGALASFAYDDLGRRTSLARGNGVTTGYSYNGASWLTGMTLDLAGTNNDQTLGFTYNPAGQIASRTASNDAYAWTQHYNVSRPYAANTLNQYSSIGSGANPITPVYDVKGNLASAGSTSYAYNVKNQLTYTSDGGRQFYYDPAGRIDSVLDAGFNGITGFQYDGDQIVTELNTAPGSGFPVLRRYVDGPGTDEPLVWYEGSGTSDKRYLVADERGSVVAVTDANGNATAINSYDEYGVPASTNLGRFQYTGQAWMPELGLYSFKARMYSPTFGRFMQTDPIGYADGMNWYNYVGGDPVNYTDPSGLQYCDQAGA